MKRLAAERRDQTNSGCRMRFIRLLPIAVTIVACGTPDLGPDGSGLPYGTYTITRTFTTAGTPAGVFKISIVSATVSQVVFDWTSGDVAGTLPVRDTANVSGNAYFVQWNGKTIANQSLRFTKAACSGLDVDPINGSRAWPSCTIASP